MRTILLSAFAMGLAGCTASVAPTTPAATQGVYDPVGNCQRDIRRRDFGARLIGSSAQQGNAGTVRFRDMSGTRITCFVDGDGRVRHVSRKERDS